MTVMSQSRIRVVDRKTRDWRGPAAPSPSAAATRTISQRARPQVAVERLVVGIEHHRHPGRHDASERFQRCPHSRGRLRRTTAVESFVLLPASALMSVHATLAPQRPDGRGDDEQAVAFNDDRDGQRLVAVRFERFHLVDLERVTQTGVGEVTAVSEFGMAA